MPAAFVGGRRRRRHSDEFKASAVAACQQPGVSMAAVAMAHGINANLLRRWVRDGETKAGIAAHSEQTCEAPALPRPAFVPVTLPRAAQPTPEIRIEVRRGPLTIAVTWPSTAASECGAWMREL